MERRKCLKFKKMKKGKKNLRRLTKIEIGRVYPTWIVGARRGSNTLLLDWLVVSIM